MEDLVKGLMHTALDAASSALSHRHSDNSVRSSPPSSPPPDGDSTSIDRSTWAEIAAGGDTQQNNNHTSPWQGSSTHHPQTNVHYGSPKPEQEGHEGRQNLQTGDNSGWQNAENHHRRRPHGNPQQVSHEEIQGFRLPSQKQVYSEPIQFSVDVEPTQEELRDISAACNRLWDLDFNRLTPGRDYRINCGDGKKVYNKQDVAEDALFEYVSKDVFRKCTYARFYALLDNYTFLQGVREKVTEEERQEETAFIEEISRSAPIQYLFKYLTAQGIVSPSYAEFKQHLHSLWFSLYSRGGAQGSSSAFEHVFIGEIKNGCEKEVSGFHNWIKFYVEEAAGRIDYQGYILPRRRNCDDPDAHSQLLTIQFKWNNVLKPVSSTFVGVSPEFELALYTLCFYGGEEDNFVEVGPYSVNVKCFKLGRDKIGSAFPIAQE